ncbi:menaquinone biosynthesis protein [Candidatus Oleimmundimicrobium sp.]|uniref:menaquinone biosynthetic enzyme MqnA/MqnD family protein n=1 Tax=Candidatus Oleimmundimicrobium sp. TaxID=3060597 RepID=UPI00271B9A1F|nr:menaquinone biosynthesis protein [Candidatus Oleimmundimicrobium sp.]MDO8885908.1 menaquinone biosynthesis protein [Candidatus Oleimmundimicrobium sp.]
MRPKVGHIQFLNCFPLYYGLVTSNCLLGMELIKGTPTELNRMLINGKLDVSPISAMEYARHNDELYLLPNLTVSSDDEVKSILLISKVPPNELNGKKIALTNTSATSQVLVQIILKEKYKINPKYFTCPSDLPQMLHEADAALLIGDDALRALYNPQDFFVFDLGQEWKNLTGQKMVYAVWCARKEFAKENPHLLKEVYGTLRKSMEYSLRNVDEISLAASKWEIFTADFLKDYFLSLNFTFDENYQAGLKYFLNKAKEHGFLKKVPELKFAEV